MTDCLFVRHRITTARLVGVGRISDVPDLSLEPPWKIGITWDMRLTRKLCSKPLDATWLKNRLPVTKGAVVALGPTEAKWVKAKFNS